MLGAEFNEIRIERDEMAGRLKTLVPEVETLRRDFAVSERERDTLAATAKQTGEALAALTSELDRRVAAERELTADRARLAQLEREARERIALLEGQLIEAAAHARSLAQQLDVAATSSHASTRAGWAASRGASRGVIPEAERDRRNRPVRARRRDGLAARRTAAHTDGVVLRHRLRRCAVSSSASAARRHTPSSTDCRAPTSRCFIPAMRRQPLRASASRWRFLPAVTSSCSWRCAKAHRLW